MKVLWFLVILLIPIAGVLGFGLGLERAEIVYVPYKVTEYIEVERETRVQVDRIVEVSIHNEPGLHEFKTMKALKDYVRWWRNDKMVQHGIDQCEDYAYDFFQQAIADGYVVSTELVFKNDPMYGDVCHMVNLVPVGNRVYLIDVGPGIIELYALKD